MSHFSRHFSPEVPAVDAAVRAVAAASATSTEEAGLAAPSSAAAASRAASSVDDGVGDTTGLVVVGECRGAAALTIVVVHEGRVTGAVDG